MPLAALRPQMVVSLVNRLKRRPSEASKSSDRIRQRPDSTASVSSTRSTCFCPVGSGLLASVSTCGPPSVGPNISDRSTVVFARENSRCTAPSLAEPPISLRCSGRLAPSEEARPW
jgi:hypothetical protein